jgi:hypothetical protein
MHNVFLAPHVQQTPFKGQPVPIHPTGFVKPAKRANKELKSLPVTQ